MSPLQQSYDGIADEFSRLSSQWKAAASLWNDAQRVWFDAQYMQDYEPAVRSALNQMQQIGQMIAQAYSDLE